MMDRMNKTPIRLVVLILMMPSIGGTNDTIPIKDPFQPLPLTSCNQDIDHLKKWRLRGIVGRQGYHHGWALTPEGGWHKLVVGKLVLTNWAQAGCRQTCINELAGKSYRSEAG
ncbi:hypothetical protein [Candidatus Fukatsuia endosymbiont of Tuberolachnus salignus]|uniref:hypothetical protein n=1 Tax=Candidatus Fukatsuia endosymbiont of Tuberolachnus salignus TaxID=3077957 RepID=UPI00313C68EC